VRQPKRSATEAVVHPDELQDIHEEEKQETDRNMENMWRQLKRLGPGSRVRLTHLVCNHSSFAQTVENIFTLSFLVRAAEGAAVGGAVMWCGCWLTRAVR
jgi:DNA-binding TFAR19-related protein (PDSD5 family)